MRDLLSIKNSTCRILRGILSFAVVFGAQVIPLHAEGPVEPPLLEFSTGLAGRQVKLTWNSVAGTVYRIERSTTLGAWAQVALVKASGAETGWTDPEVTTNKSFYRITQPEVEVSTIMPTVISTVGGELVVEGQGIPLGSFLMLEWDGQILQVPLAAAGNGIWEASVVGQFLEDAGVIATGIVDGSGTVIVPLNVPITVTATGRALDAPPSLPPGAPVVQEAVSPIKGVGVVIKKNPGHNSSERTRGKVILSDLSPLAVLKTRTKSNQCNERTMGGSGDYFDDGGSSPLAVLKTRTKSNQCNERTLSGGDYFDDGGSSPLAVLKTRTKSNQCNERTLSGGDYFDDGGSSPLAVLKTRTKSNQCNERTMGGSGDCFEDDGGGSVSKTSEAKCSIGALGRTLPGEVHVPVSALSLVCPAGPNIDWVCTYRSMAPVNSSHGPGWDFSYNISIEPLPAAAGAAAPRVAVRDGQGRRDIYYRQPDGSYRCPGMFREGRFDGDVFTLTFADTGKWVFAPLSHRSVPKMIILMTDRNGVSLTCDYDVAGKLASVSSQFGQSIAVAYAGDRISSITDHTGRSVSFSYYGASDPGGREGDLLAISCPQEIGQPPAAGPVTFTYSTGSPDPRLNGNLLSATDGAGRLLGAFTYSSETDPLHINYDSCATAERYKTGHVTINRRELLPPGISPKGGYTIFEIDEVGRVMETVCDRLHRPVTIKEFTGFSTPNVPVTSSSNRPTGKLRATDPDFFLSTFSYNLDSLCNRAIYPDGSQEIITYDRDFRRDCPVREAGNPRVTTLRTPSGEERTVTCDYLPGFGSSESEMRVGPVKGAVIKGGRPPGGNYSTRMVSAHGQVTSCSYDSKGNLTAVTSPVLGRGSLFDYNPLGQLTSSTTLNGPGSSFTDTCSYDGTTKFLSSVICDSSGLNITTTCERDTLGRITRVIDPRGNDEICSYNALDQVVSIQSPPVPQRIVTSFHYDAGGSLARCDVEHRDSSGNLVSANPAYSSFLVYDDHGLLIRTAEEERPVDGSGLLIPDSLGIGNFAVCDIMLNDSGECIRLSTPAACRAQSSDLVCDFTYDERGLLHRTHDGGIGNPGGLITECDYDLYGAMTRCAVSGQGTVSEILASYDGFHRLSTETDPMGNVRTYDYDNRGYVTCSVFGEVNDVPGSAGNTLLYRIVAPASHMAINTKGAGGINRFAAPVSYHAINTKGAGGINRFVAPVSYHAINTKGAGGINRFVAPVSYHAINTKGAGANDRIIAPVNSHAINTKGAGSGDRMMSPFFGVEIEDETITCDRFTPGGGISQEITTIDRSPAGLVQQVSCNSDLLESCFYDSAGRLTGHVCGQTSHFFTLNTNGDVTESSRTDTCPSDAAQTKTFTISHVFDAVGRITQTTDGIGNVSSCAYDSLDRPVSYTEPGGLVTRCAYDGSSAAGPFSEEISADAVTPSTFVVLSRSLVRSGELRSSSDSYGHTTTCDTDALGRLIRCEYPDGTFETRSHVHINVGTIGHVDHGRTTMTYDLNGRLLTSLTTSDPLVAPVSSTPQRTFTYNGLGHCTSVSQGVHVVACSYDSLGNLLSETQDGRTVSSTYNHRGRTSLTYPNGDGLVETRDALGLLSSTAPNAAFTQRAPHKSPNITHEYHRAGHRVIRSVQGNGLVTTYQYRGDGEPAIPGGADFTFDACVKVNVSDLSITIHRRDRNQRDRRFELSFAAGDDAPLRSKTYTRDRLGRVTGCTNRSRTSTGGPILITGEVSYTLDLEGNRLSATGGDNPGTYEQLTTLPPGDQQMGQYSSWPRGPLEWDDNGNLISMATATGTLSLSHDVEGRLTAISRGGVPLIAYDYDPLGRLISRDPETGPATTFLYDGLACVQELGDDGLPDLTHILCDGVRQGVFTGDDTFYYPHGGIHRGIHHWGDRGEAANKVEHWGDPHENLNGRMNLLTNSTGIIVERFDCDDAGKPVFLNPAGLPTGAAGPVGPIKWMSPESFRRIWESEIGTFHGTGGLYSPDLGRKVSSQKTPKPSAQKDLMNIS